MTGRRALQILTRWRFVAVLLAGLALCWWLVSAQSLASSFAGMGGTLALGDQMLVGHPGLVDRDVTVLTLEPNASPGLEVEFMVCETDGSSDAIGSVPASDAPQFCKSLRPIARGTALEANPPEGSGTDYLVVGLRPTTSGAQWLCGFDARYRSGWRFGWQQDVGPRVLLNAESGAQSDRCS